MFLNPYLTKLVYLLEETVIDIVVNHSTHSYYYACYHWFQFIPVHNKWDFNLLEIGYQSHWTINFLLIFALPSMLADYLYKSGAIKDTLTSKNSCVVRGADKQKANKENEKYIMDLFVLSIKNDQISDARMSLNAPGGKVLKRVPDCILY